MAPAFPRIQAAAIDGRFDNIYHRQVELEKLCKALIDNVNEIKQAIAADSGHSPTEVAVEYNEALSAVKRAYATLIPEDAYNVEYLVANGKDASHRRAAAGIVYIEPTTHTLFYSVIVPLSSALAAGNAVVVLLENNLRAVPGLLRRLLHSSLDADAFAIASNAVRDDELPETAFRVLQNGVQHVPRTNQITSRSDAIVVAVVDRTADVSIAARDLVAARSRFGGTSPYAADVVLINEFVKQDFLQAVASEFSSHAKETDQQAPGTSDTRAGEVFEQMCKSDSEAMIMSRQGSIAVVDVHERNARLLAKSSPLVMKVHAVKSLDDAIDLINFHSVTPARVAYHFGTSHAGKYLSQFIPAEMTFVNHIPYELLLGPAAPSRQSPDLLNRYSTNDFTLSRPVQIAVPLKSQRIATVFASPGSAATQRLIAEATAPLKAFKRNPGGGVGFFEQGFLYSAGLIVASTLTVSVTGIYWLWKWSRPV